MEGKPGLCWRQSCLCVREWSNPERKTLHITYILVSNIRFFNIKGRALIRQMILRSLFLKLSWVSGLIPLYWSFFSMFSLRNQCLPKISALLITSHCFCTFISFSVCIYFQVQSFHFCRTSNCIWPLHLYLPQMYLRRKHSWFHCYLQSRPFFAVHWVQRWISCCFLVISSVQLLSRVRLFATPWTAARQASLSITNSWSTPKPMSIESVMPSNHFILCHPLLFLPSIFPSIRVFSNVALCIR